MRHNQENARDVKEFYNKGYVHKSIFWREIVDIMGCSLKKGEGLLVDATIGEGGHSEILLNVFPGLKIRGFERDSSILERAKSRLSSYGDRVELINDNFSEMAGYFQDGAKPDYILYDFGISSYHFEMSGKGFSFAEDEPLDMRLDNNGVTAAYIVNNYPERELERIIMEYGEENWARRIAKVIGERRKMEPVETTGQLASIVLGAIPKRFHVKNIHPATRVFQALRIEVNRELEAIEKGLEAGFNLLNTEGVMMAISFHSLEDRIVKNYFRRLKKGCLCGKDPRECECRHSSFVEILTKKPLVPADDEIEWNNRSRSAKLRAAVKISEVL
jgi:16S rRNA (cytosine1402-N4)-methyltransferase